MGSGVVTWMAVSLTDSGRRAQGGSAKASEMRQNERLHIRLWQPGQGGDDAVRGKRGYREQKGGLSWGRWHKRYFATRTCRKRKSMRHWPGIDDMEAALKLAVPDTK